MTHRDDYYGTEDGFAAEDEKAWADDRGAGDGEGFGPPSDRDPRILTDPRDVVLADPVGCCRVRQTLQIGPAEESSDDIFKTLWEGRTELEMGTTDCGAGPGVGLLSMNFVSFTSSSGDFSGPTRQIEVFLTRSSKKPDLRTDVVSVPIFRGTTALMLRQFQGGFPVPLNPHGPYRFSLRTRVAQQNNGTRWSFLCGLMLTRQNAF